MKKEFIFVHLFGGILCGRKALENIGFDYPSTHYSFEINPESIAIAQKNYPDTIQMGSVVDISDEELIRLFRSDDKVVVIEGGFPCKDLSCAGRRRGMTIDDAPEEFMIDSLDMYLQLKSEGVTFTGTSYLYWEMRRFIEVIKPNFFIVENVIMNGKMKKVMNMISDDLGVLPTSINASKVSAQNRDRLFWVNQIVDVPEDQFQSISKYIPGAVGGSGTRSVGQNSEGRWTTRKTTTRKDGKSNTLTCSTSCAYISMVDGTRRPLTVLEMEVLQGLSEGYTSLKGITKKGRITAIGNGMSVPVMEHIYRSTLKEYLVKS